MWDFIEQHVSHYIHVSCLFPSGDVVTAYHRLLQCLIDRPIKISLHQILLLDFLERRLEVTLRETSGIPLLSRILFQPAEMVS